MECAVVTHSGLRAVRDETGKARMEVKSPLEEPYVIRPTSETIIGHFFQPVDPEPPRPAAAHQPVGQRDALGDAHADVPAHERVSLAGGPHRALDARARPWKRCGDARRVRRLRGKRHGHARHPRPEDRQRALRRRAHHLLHRGHDAGRQGPAGRHEPRPRAELRQGLRREVPEKDGRAWSTSGRPPGASPRASSAASS
jgi:hypothetical protein